LWKTLAEALGDSKQSEFWWVEVENIFEGQGLDLPRPEKIGGKIWLEVLEAGKDFMSKNPRVTQKNLIDRR